MQETLSSLRPSFRSGNMIPDGLIWLSDECAAGPPADRVLTWTRQSLAADRTMRCRVRFSIDAGASEAYCLPPGDRLVTVKDW